MRARSKRLIAKWKSLEHRVELQLSIGFCVVHVTFHGPTFDRDVTFQIWQKCNFQRKLKINMCPLTTLIFN